MPRFLPQKKKLLEEVYEKASEEAIETSYHGILMYLERALRDDFRISLSYNSFKTYYETIVKKDEDYNIRETILNDLSRYLGYDNFRAYCLEWKTIEYTINHAISKIVINVINKPMINITEFLGKHKSMSAGIFGIVALSGFLATKTDLLKKKECMYWDGDEYQLAYCDDKDPSHNLIPADTAKLKHFKEITRPDTLTTENSKGKVWYDKSHNVVKFFTSPGKHPENGKELKDASDYMINTHTGVK
jgi:hypothetical protein